MVTGPLGSIGTFVYSGIWNLSTVLTKIQLTAVNLLSVLTVEYGYAKDPPMVLPMFGPPGIWSLRVWAASTLIYYRSQEIHYCT